MSRIPYHLEELEIALNPESEAHLMPTVLPDDQSILDVGCGIGQTLVALNLDEKKRLVGVEPDTESLAYGQKHYPSIEFVNCSAEQLQFEDTSFDLVISRVALPYTNIPQALEEMHRVLKPGGRLWITLHPQKKTWGQLFSAIRNFNVKDVLFRTYILANGASYHLLGKLFAFPFNKKFESFQTSRSIRNALQASGFSDLEIARGKHFLVTAKKGH